MWNKDDIKDALLTIGIVVFTIVLGYAVLEIGYRIWLATR